MWAGQLGFIFPAGTGIFFLVSMFRIVFGPTKPLSSRKFPHRLGIWEATVNITAWCSGT
jgi:hypothetical protein